MHSYKETEDVVKYLDIIKHHISYVKVLNEADIEALACACYSAIPLRPST